MPPLNKNAEPLLGFVGGQPRADYDRKREKKLARTVPVESQPISSADEGDDNAEPVVSKPVAKNGMGLEARGDSSDESEAGPRSRGDIKKTTFGSKKGKSQTNGKKKLKRPSDEDLSEEEPKKRPAKRNKRKRDDGAIDSQSARATPSQTTPASSQFTDEHGFPRSRKLTATYGSQKGASSQGSQGSQKKKKKDSKVTRLKAPEPLSSPKKSQKTKLEAPKSSIPSSPGKAPRLKKIPEENDLSSSQEAKPALKPPQSASQGSRSSKPSLLANWQRRLPEKKEKKKKQKPESPPTSPRAKFMMPADFSDMEDDNRRSGNGDAYSLPSDIENLSDDSHASEDQEVEEAGPGGVTTCPWCGEPVEEAILRDFSKGRRLNVKMRREFCQKHKKEAARDIWRSRRYPTIQWNSLEDRFEEHREFLLRVIGGEPSHFRKIFAEGVDSGKAARTLQKEDNLNPGYYGTRGFNLMCDYFSSDLEFSDLLKEKAVGDRAIFGRGTPAFVQRVLVAELAVRLIQEDMDVSNREAREIMEESKAVGELIHGQN